MTTTREPQDAEPGSADVRVAPGAYYLGGLILGFGHDLLLQAMPPLPSSLRPLGAALLAGGLLVGFAGLFALHRAGTAIDPMKKSTALVTSGIYRLTRNPAYLGLGLAYAGVALLGRSTASLTVLPVVLVLISERVIQREERYLQTVFGPAYEEYRGRVGRWL